MLNGQDIVERIQINEEHVGSAVRSCSWMVNGFNRKEEEILQYMLPVVLEVLMMSFPSHLLHENVRSSQEQKVLAHALHVL